MMILKMMRNSNKWIIKNNSSIENRSNYIDSKDNGVLIKGSIFKITLN
jgi:hypothetical protein